MLAALSVADRLVTSPETFLLPEAAARGVGVIAMKVLRHGTVTDREAALRYTLGLPGVALAIVGLKTPDEIDEIVDSAARYRPLPEAELGRLIDEVRPLVERDAEESARQGQSRLFWLHDTAVMGWQEHDEPALVAY